MVERVVWRRRRGQAARGAAGNIILHLHPAKVPAAALRFSYTWGLGGAAALLTLMLAATGILLMFRYEPTVDRAYLSITTLESRVAFGALIRAVHHWSANLLVIVAFLHLLRVFFRGGFKGGRGGNWLVGLGLLGLVLVFNFTGCLLPWDQLAYWAATVGTSLIDAVPLVGPPLAHLLRGGAEVGQPTLSNFYATHVAVLPAVLVLALAYHFWRVRKNGGISQPLPAPGERAERVATIPHLVSRELALATVLLTTMVLWSMVRPAPLGPLANPLQSPNPAKAAWYFGGIQELLLHLPPRALLVLLTAVVAGLLWLPRWDRAEESMGHFARSRAGRRAALAGLSLGLYLPPLLVVADEFWVDLPAWLPGWPVLLTVELLPLLLTLLGLGVIYLGLRLLRTNRAEAFVGLFTFLCTSLVLLTIVGVFFRGPNMALVLPF